MPKAMTPELCSLAAQRAASLAESAPNWRAASKIQRGTKPAEGDDLRRLANGREIRFHILHAAQHHADGNRDFGVDHVLAQKFFEQPAGDKRVVLRIAQEGSDPFEDVDESGESSNIDSAQRLLPGSAWSRGGRQVRRRCRDGWSPRDADGARLWEESRRSSVFASSSGIVVSRIVIIFESASHAVSLRRQLRTAGVDPSGHPIRADVGRGVRELADQHGPGLRVKAVVIRIAIG